MHLEAYLRAYLRRRKVRLGWTRHTIFFVKILKSIIFVKPANKMSTQTGTVLGSRESDVSPGLTSDMYTSLGPIGMERLCDPPDSTLEYEPNRRPTKHFLTSL